MQAKYIGGGARRELIQYTPVVNVAVGTVVAVADRALVAPHTIPANTLGTLSGGGIWALPKKPNEEWLQGERLYWDANNQWATTDFQGLEVARNLNLGSAAASANRGEASGAVALESAPGTPGTILMQKRLAETQQENTRMYPKHSSEAWAYDQLIYLDGSGIATTVAAGNTLIGRAARDVAADPAGLGSDLGRVYLG